MGILDSVLALFGVQPKITEEELALRAAIGRDPDSDAPRTAYADWLTQQKNPLGEYIRLSCQLAKLAPNDPQRDALVEREQELINKYGKSWVRPFKQFELQPIFSGHLIPELWFERGLIERLTIDKRDAIPGQIDKLFELAPALRHLTFERCSPDWNAIAGCSALSRLRGLDLSFDKLKISSGDLRRLLASPALAGITSLDLGNKEFGDELVEALEKSTLKRLKVLKLGSCRLPIEAIQRLAAWPGLANLEELSLSYNKLGPDGISALVQAQRLQRVVELDLNGCDVGDEGLAALSRAELPALKRLDLASNNLELPGVQAFAKAKFLPQLQTLSLAYNRLNDEAAGVLARCNSLANLLTFELNSNEIGPAGAIALFAAPQWKQVTKFSIAYNPILAEGMNALIASKRFSSLRSIDAYNLDTKDETLKAQLEAAFPQANVTA